MMRLTLEEALAPGESITFGIEWWFNINDRMKIGGRGGYEYFEADDTEYIAALSDMNLESLRRTRDLARIQYPVCNITVPIEIAPQLTRLTLPPMTLLG